MVNRKINLRALCLTHSATRHDALSTFFKEYKKISGKFVRRRIS